jgi:hypothetical protein
VLFCGWLVILVSAAIILPPAGSKVSSVGATPILVLMFLWLLLSVIALSVYFYRAWRRVGLVENKAAYVVWMSIETGFAVTVIAGLVWFFVAPS